MSKAFQVVRDFEECVAAYAGSKYGVAVDSCSNAIFLALQYRRSRGRFSCVVGCPKRTYPSVPAAILHSGYPINFHDLEWQGIYELEPLEIHDGAKRFRRHMYAGGLHCLSFHAKKILPIGRGGMILTDDEHAYRWLKLARFDGREECALSHQTAFTVLGWNFYMSPEQAARGLWLMGSVKDFNPDQVEDPPYPDLSKFKVFQGGGA